MAAQELRWLTYLLTDLGEAPRSPPVLYVNNKAMLALCQEHRLEHRTKHIALRYFLARELQQHGQLRLAYVASQANTADVFTKALQPCDHQPCFAFLDWSCDLLFSPTLPMGPAPLLVAMPPLAAHRAALSSPRAAPADSAPPLQPARRPLAAHAPPLQPARGPCAALAARSPPLPPARRPLAASAPPLYPARRPLEARSPPLQPTRCPYGPLAAPAARSPLPCGPRTAPAAR
ncbi:unnamed protein product [Closterium sp. NIES-53]